eukprot:COSAG02_NODE_10358_length_1960_cov_1.652337_1_plen_131_part_00
MGRDHAVVGAVERAFRRTVDTVGRCHLRLRYCELSEAHQHAEHAAEQHSIQFNPHGQVKLVSRGLGLLVCRLLQAAQMARAYSNADAAKGMPRPPSPPPPPPARTSTGKTAAQAPEEPPLKLLKNRRSSS